MLGLLLAILVWVSACAAPMETVTERQEAVCDADGGTWSTFGCIYTLPAPPMPTQRDCIQAGGIVGRWGDCSVQVMEVQDAQVRL